MSKRMPCCAARPSLLLLVVVPLAVVLSVLPPAGPAPFAASVAALVAGPIAPVKPDIAAIAAAVRDVISRPLRRGIAAHGSTAAVVEAGCGVADVSVLALG